MQKYPEYTIDIFSIKNFHERRQVAAKQALAYKTIKSLSLEGILQNLKRPATSTRNMMQFFPDSTIKYSVSNSLFTNAILNMGSSRHLHYISDIEDKKVG